MRSPLRTLLSQAQLPVPFTGRTTSQRAWGRPSGQVAQMAAMGSVGTLFAIVSRLSNATAQVEWKLYRKGTAGGERTEVTAHAALDLWNRPNPFYPQQEFVETIQQHLDLTGEGWWVIARDPRSPIPLELWPVRPDRMTPVPDPDTFLRGYMYRAPGGEEVALELDQVIQLRMPNPLDPYRGMGPVQSILAELDAARYSAEWNRAFFLNSAQPGGIIKVDKRLGDAEFDELRTRWNESHRGVANAHRVAILEQGEWIDRKYTQQDMQFTALREQNRELIREAFGFPKPLLGSVDDVNRANAEAGEVVFARWLIVPRLARIKAALNNDLLPLFGPSAKGLEFDYESPVPEDEEAAARVLSSRAAAAGSLINGGVYGPEALALAGLPDAAFGQPGSNPDRELLIKLVTGAPLLAPLILPLLGFELPATQPAPTGGSTARHATRPVATWEDSVAHLRGTPLRNQDSDAELETIRADHQAALDQLMTAWDGVDEQWFDQVAEQVQAAADSGDTDFGGLELDTTQPTTVLRRALGSMAEQASARVVETAAKQGVTIEPPEVDPELTARLRIGQLRNAYGTELLEVARDVAAYLAASMATLAGAEAARQVGDGEPREGLGRRVVNYLRTLATWPRRDALGGALHQAQNTARLATMAAGPAATYTASEKNDANTCAECEDIDGTVFADLAASQAAYGTGGYSQCQGGGRCRGTVIASWP